MDSDQVSAIIAGVDFASIIVGIGAITAAVIVVVLAVRGARFLIDGLRNTPSTHNISWNHLYEEEGDYEKYGKYKERNGL